ncbi:eukaryotic translation initiation factor 3 subunit L [Puccinia sorghi]|uniref:Eukaryotic translation initiation factor 3 subunit L n=1 Tax=Puccinia sorghi TaxID=27349 RepID=A0A0L6VNU1_9BASI|nr:eukaryotic translation initiation factor 3 subunit L [Puccinia sorghi]
MSYQQTPAALERQYYSDEEDDFYEQGVTDAQIPLGMRQEGYGEGNLNDQYLQQQQFLLAQAAVAQQQAQEAAVALAAVPEPVRKVSRHYYIVYLHTTLLSANPQEIFAAYEGGWNRLTEKFYQKAEWPEADIIAPLVNNDEVFLLFYRELYYRHVYSRLQPDIDDRFHSYENYCSIFNYILNSEGPVPLDLPVQWLWDIIDEFIYQFASFTTWKGRMARKTEEEIQLIAENPQVWSCYSVLNVLYSLITKSKIQEQLAATRKGEDPDEVGGEWGARPLYRMLGYFSIIGLLRVHVLLGDYTLALQMMNDVELTKKALFTRVNAAHVTVHYYVAFSYIMLRRYPDATRSLTHILYFLQRLKGYHTRGYQFDAINKQGDRMYALLAICQAISPSKIDESISNTMKEKYGEQFSKMLSGGDASLASFQELFTFASPKFLSLSSPPYDRPELLPQYVASSSPSENPSAHHLKLFLSDIQTQLPTPSLRSFLKLYTTLSISKLAGFLGVDEEEVLESLMVLKASMRSVRRSDGDYGLIEGKEVALGDMDFAIDGDIVQVTETKPGRRFNEYFIRHTDKARTMYEQLMAQPLPIPPKAGPALTATAAAPSASQDQPPAWAPSIKVTGAKA